MLGGLHGGDHGQRRFILAARTIAIPRRVDREEGKRRLDVALIAEDLEHFELARYWLVELNMIMVERKSRAFPIRITDTGIIQQAFSMAHAFIEIENPKQADAFPTSRKRVSLSSAVPADDD